MKRFLAAVTLTATPLLMVAAPVAAAPPQHITFSECYPVDDTGGIYCYTTDTTSKITDTPSGNHIEHTSGTNTYSLVWGPGSPYPNYNGVDTLEYKAQFKKSEAHVVRFKQTLTRHFDPYTCTTVITFKSTNGKVQVDQFQSACV